MLTRPAPVGLALALLAAGFLRVPARADDELHTPYELHIVLHVAEHRQLGEVFRERVTRELRDGLQAALGDLGHVTLVHEHPRLADVLTRGLDKGLDGWAERSGIKTHFVLIDIAGPEYEIQARQHDGVTGRTGRVVRRDRTRDRDFVARAAALLVAKDLGLVGTVRGEPDGQKQVQIEMQAGALGPLDRWLRKGQVFEIIPPGGAVPLEWALLQVLEPPAETDRSGVVLCKLWHRYELGSLKGYRCLLLGTTRAALRLRFMQEKARGVQTPLDRTLQVVLRHNGFEGEDTTRLPKSTDPGGWVDTSGDGKNGVFEDVAFVAVTGGLPAGQRLPQAPVAIVDDRPVFIPVTVTSDPGGLFASRRATWERNVADSYLVQVSLFQEIQELAAKPEGRARAQERAQVGLQRTKEDYERLSGERNTLALEAGRAGGPPFKPVREDQRLKDLQEGAAMLQRFLGHQKDFDRIEKDPKKKEWRDQVARARLLEDEFEIDKAIKIYEQVLKEGLDNPDLRRHLEDLKAQWAFKDLEHRDARRFIYHVWPELKSAALLKEQLEEARKAFKKCREVEDYIACRKLFKATEAHAVRLTRELEGLKPKINIDDERPAKLIEEVTPGLTALSSDIFVFLQRKLSPEP